MMNGRRLLVVGALLLVAGESAVAQPAAAKPLPALVDAASRSLARLKYSIRDEMFNRDLPAGGQALCIDAVNDTFLTRDVPTRVAPGALKDFKLIPAGTAGEGVDAELLGSDPEQGFTFLRAKEKRNWLPLRFSPKANLKLGDRVVSVGLLGPQAGNVPYLGMATIGAHLRVPHHLYYVCGGELTIRTSPVMTTEGRVVGIVGEEKPMQARIQLGGRWMQVATMGDQRTRFFLPVDEFAHVLTQIPVPGRPKRLPWTGVYSFEAVVPEKAKLLKALGDRPAALVGEVIPASPAANVGIEQGDAVIKLNGKPLEKLPTAALVRDNFIRLLNRQKVGQPLVLTVLRDPKGEIDYKLTPEPWPMQDFEAERYYNRNLGFAARNLVQRDAYAGRAHPLAEKKGVLVFQVVPNSSAHRGELAQGDLITAANNKPVANVKALEAVVDPVSQPGSVTPVTFLVLRGEKGKAHAITMTPPPVRRTQP